MTNQDDNKFGYESHQDFLEQIQEEYDGMNREEMQEEFNDHFRHCIEILAELTRRTNPTGAKEQEEQLTFNVYTSMQQRLFAEVGMESTKDQIGLFQEYVNLIESFTEQQKQIAQEAEPEEIRNIYGLNQGEQGNE